ncbi:MAG: thioredoxin domain-containing protein [Deltaproteobacteria bacterium]|nr:thioredoxin domain-containing protein [Deltaproteobacteria bacterium]
MVNNYKNMNHLIGEKSPYLLQHSMNPVNWYPWSEEAFKRATSENKPVFLSIGYATCHWCHVMEHESFEDKNVAEILNKNFISIKVDREERPDVDNYYMNVCQAMTGSGGWPLTIIMTPDKKPFWAGTYIPKTARFGRPGMMELLPKLADIWETQKEDLITKANTIEKALRQKEKALTNQLNPEQSDNGLKVNEQFKLGFGQLASVYDPVNGGFGDNMKFPSPHNLIFLLHYYNWSKNPGALEMVENTLKNMRGGGIFDQLGLGFHRYSTEPTWTVPHFEKMLYDQALLLWAYSEAYGATKNSFYKDVAVEISNYVFTNLTSKTGAFYSAEDADSEGVEGKFYLFQEDEFDNLLNSNMSEYLKAEFGVTKNGNFKDPHSNMRGNILTLRDNEKSLKSMPFSEAEINRAIKSLLSYRNKRVRPFLDDKIITDWNGLMIGALAIGAGMLDDEQMREGAELAAADILSKMKLSDYHLFHRYRENDSSIKGMLDDYAFMIFAMTELYQTTQKTDYLISALEFTKVVQRDFMDKDEGTFFMNPDIENDLPSRPKDFYDGAIPSGNSMMMYNLIRLARITGNTTLEESASKLSKSIKKRSGKNLYAHTLYLIGQNFAAGPSVEIVLVEGENKNDIKEFKNALNSLYFPPKVTIVKNENNKKELERLAPYTKDQIATGNKTTAYVCVKNSCSLPVTDPAAMIEIITKQIKK